MIRGLHHIGISVVNLERSVSFYRDVLGMTVIVEESPFAGERYAQIMALNAPRGRVALLKSGSLQLELFEFTQPVPRRSETDRAVCDQGITHFCVEVTDMNQEYERMKAAGVTFHCAPVDFPGAARASYGRDPDGNVFELLEPGGGAASDI